MIKNFLIFQLIFIFLFISGCGTPETSEEPQEPNRSFALINDLSDTYEKINLSTETFYPASSVFYDNKIYFSNQSENDRISAFPVPDTPTAVIGRDTNDFIDFYSDSFGIINGILYFANLRDANHLYEYNLKDNTFEKLNTSAPYDVTAVNKKIYFKDRNNNNKLSVFDSETGLSSELTDDNAGRYLINGDYIIYQNNSDSSKIYAINQNTLKKQKLTDFGADSFIIYKGNILYFNSEDNNSLFLLNLSDLTTRRLSTINGSDIQTAKDSIYFINNEDNNSLYSLGIDDNLTSVSYSSLIEDSINSYQASDTGILYHPSFDSEKLYFKKF